MSIMDKIMKTRFFSLLSETSQKVTNKKIQDAYAGFMEHLKTFCQSERNYSESFRILNLTRIEIKYLHSLFRYEQEKKCPEICIFSKSISNH